MSGREARFSQGDVQYRRGAIMGLTVAESFMLITFLLLMLLALWRIEKEDEAARDGSLDRFIDLRETGIDMNTHRSMASALVAPASELVNISRVRFDRIEQQARLVSEEDIRELVEVASRLDPEVRRQLTDLARVGEFKNVIGRLNTLEEVVGDKSMDEIATALELAKTAEEEGLSNAGMLRERAQLVSEDDIRELVEVASRLEPEMRQQLTDLARVGEFKNVIGRLNALEEVVGDKSMDEIATALELAKTAEEEGLSNAGMLRERAQLVSEDDIRELVEVASRLEPEMRQQLTDLARVGEFKNVIGRLNALEEVVGDKSMDEIATALELAKTAEEEGLSNAGMLRERAQLVSEDDIRELVEVASRLEPEMRQQLTDLARVGEFKNVIGRLNALEEVVGDKSMDEIATALELAKTAEEEGLSNAGMLRERAQLVSEDDIRELVEVASRLEPEMRQQLTDLARVGEFKNVIGRLNALEEVVGDKGIDEIATALELAKTAEEERLSDAGMLRERAQLVSEDDIRELVEVASRLEPEVRQQLTDLARVGEFRDVIARLNALEEVVGSKSAEVIANALKLASTAEEEGLNDADALRARIQQHFREEKETQNALVASLRRELGDSVARMGGRIMDDGAVVLPDEVLFQVGSAELLPSLERFLEGFCQPWLITLRSSDLEIDEIRIEGHASSEWEGASSTHDAFVHNLDLSQRRAQSVLERCLSYAGDSARGEWARQHLTAVGYSSSRLVQIDGRESPRLSRRVVFSASLDHNRLLEEIGDEITETQVKMLESSAQTEVVTLEGSVQDSQRMTSN